jgi:hypothetical protein
MPVAHLHATRLFYVEVGEGVPCLVMHGGLEGATVPRRRPPTPLARPSGRRDASRLYDNRGNGRSGRGITARPRAV